MRPWGRLGWVLDRFDDTEWSLIGSVSAEDRALAVPSFLRDRGMLHVGSVLLEIEEVPGHPEDSLPRQIRAAQKARLKVDFDPSPLIQRHTLLQSVDRTMRVADDRAADCDSSIVLDITAMPKRFFFPLLKRLVALPNVKNLLVTYASAARYGEPPLHFDPEPVAHIPTFLMTKDQRSKEDLVVFVGFDSPGLNQVVESGEFSDVHLILGYPALPPLLGQNWDAVNEMVKALGSTVSVSGVSSLDVSSAFERLCAISNGGSRSLILAPYGPKPTSVACCLYALRYPGNTSAVYTQPKYYASRYSSGVASDELGDVIHAFVIKHQGVSLY